MTITAEQLDELERKALAAQKAAALASLKGIAMPLAEYAEAQSAGTLLQLVAIARAALAWSEADRRLTNASYSIGDYDSAQAMVSDALDGIRTALRDTP